MVESVPECPVFRSCRRSKASPPRISPRTMRSGRWRRAAFRRSRMATAGRPFCSRRAAIGQPRIKNGLRFGDIVTKTAGDILYRDHEGSLTERYARHLLQEALFFDEHPVGAVHHHLAD